MRIGLPDGLHGMRANTGEQPPVTPEYEYHPLPDKHLPLRAGTGKREFRDCGGRWKALSRPGGRHKDHRYPESTRWRFRDLPEIVNPDILQPDILNAVEFLK